MGFSERPTPQRDYRHTRSISRNWEEKKKKENTRIPPMFQMFRYKHGQMHPSVQDGKEHSCLQCARRRCLSIVGEVAESIYSIYIHINRVEELLQQKHTTVSIHQHTHTQMRLSLIPAPSCSRPVTPLFFTHALLGVDRHLHMIKDCPLAAGRCWLKWSRPNYCNKGKKGLGCILKGNPYTSAQGGDGSSNICVTVPP